MRENPYLGVTGVTSAKQAESILQDFPESSLPDNYRQMLGILAGPGTIKGNPLNARYTGIENYSGILTAGKIDGAFMTIHYGSKNSDALADKISALFEHDNIYEDNLCRGIQINTPDPELKEIREIKEIFPEMVVILPVTGALINAKTPEEISGWVAEYPADYVLIDPSGGAGKQLDLSRALEIYRAINRQNQEITIGFAGGLNSSNVYGIARELAIKIGPVFCLDAEGRLMDDNVLNSKKVHDYRIEAARGLSLVNS